MVLIGAIEVLPKLFDEILIPPSVQMELERPRTSALVRDWLASLPSWVRVQCPFHIDPSISLGPGETEAISLALELGLATIIIDERKGSIAAERLGILPVGTLNILDSADRRGLLGFEEAVAKLRATNFSHCAGAN